MSEHQGAVTSVLLPTSRVSIFAASDDIKAAVEVLRKDWRFTRVSIELYEGDVESAIAVYGAQESPNLVIVETLEIKDGFIDRLEVLGGSCGEDTAAVVVGPINDVYLYRKLIDMGVSDYLVRPITEQILSDLIAKILIEKLGAPGSKLVACVGSKGGVGTSNIAYLLADTIASESGQKTMLMDVAAGWSYLSVAMGTEATTTLHEVARASVSTDKESFKRMIVPVNDKLSFLATGAEPLFDDVVAPDNLELILTRLMQTYPVVVLDLSRAPTSILRTILSRANEVVVVATPTLPALRPTRGLIQEIKTLRGGSDKEIHLVVNMKGITQGQDIPDADIGTALKMKTELVIPFLPKVFTTAEMQGKLVSSIAGGKEVATTVAKFVREGLGIGKDARASDTATKDNSTTGTGGLLGGLLGKMKTK